MMYFLNVDENGYLLSISRVGGGIEAEIDLKNYDFTRDRIRAHKWDGETLVFDADRYAEIEAKNAEKETEPTPAGASVYDELAEAYRKGVQEA